MFVLKFLGIVLLQRPDGQYEGEIQNFSPHGKGVYVWNNGDAYYGNQNLAIHIIQ